MLNESIDLAKEEKSKMFAHIQGKAISGYYILSAVSMIVSGFIYDINPYYPMILSLIVVVVTLLMSMKFNEPVVTQKSETKEDKLSLKESILFVFS